MSFAFCFIHLLILLSSLKQVFDVICYDLTYVIAPFIKADMTAIPNPLPDTMKISTNSLFLLKYCATISVLQSRVIPTPIPARIKKSDGSNIFVAIPSFS